MITHTQDPESYVDVYYCIPSNHEGIWSSGSQRIQYKNLGTWITMALMGSSGPILITDIKVV